MLFTSRSHTAADRELMKDMKPFTFMVLATVGIVGCLFASQRKPEVSPISDRSVAHFQSRGDSVLQTILKLGMETKTPLGMVVEDDRLCQQTVNVSASEKPATAVLGEILKNIAGFGWKVYDGVVVIEPESPSKSIVWLLNSRIPRYAEPPSTISQLTISLEMHVRALLRPQGGSISDTLSSDGAPKSAPIEMRNATVKELLNRIVTQAGGGEWVVPQLPADYRDLATKQAFRVVSFADGPNSLSTIKCVP